jgi:hypothetical protein
MIDKAGNGCYIFLLAESQAAEEREEFRCGTRSSALGSRDFPRFPNRKK